MDDAKARQDLQQSSALRYQLLNSFHYILLGVYTVCVNVKCQQHDVVIMVSPCHDVLMDDTSYDTVEE
jgi:hypothetical protein